MSGFASPGLFFIGTVVPKEMHFLRSVLEHARHAGYRRLVEPAAGAFAMCGLGRQAGWETKEMEASDVAFLSAVLGYAIMEHPIDALQVQFHDPLLANLDVTDHATVLYGQMLARYLVKAGKTAYWREIVRDMSDRKDDIIASINAQLGEARKALGGFTYRARCMFGHLAEAMDDPRAIISLNPPTLTGGWEKFYDTGGRMTWQEPAYAMFDPKVALKQIADMAIQAKALVLLYEEKPYGESVLPAVFARAGALKAPGDTGPVRSMNAYLSSNRPDEVEELVRGKRIARREERGIGPCEHHIIPDTYEMTDKSRVVIAQIEERHSYYYRALWTHRFLGGSSNVACQAIIVDGYLAGLFAYNQEWLVRGRFGSTDDLAMRSLFLQYGMAPRLDGYRLNRLVMKMALQRCCMRQVVDQFLMVRVTHLVTAQFTKHPESKEMRGMMKLCSKEPVTNKFGLEKGFALRYLAPIEGMTPQEVLQWWIRDEQRYRSARKLAPSSKISALASVLPA